MSIKRLNRELDRALYEKMILVFSCTGIVMKRYYHWEQKGILDLYAKCMDVWKECAASNEKSMVQMLDEEADVVISTEDGKSWQDLPYLNASIGPERMTRPQIAYMKARMKKWLLPQMTACMLLALHRKCGFDPDAIAEIYQRLLEVERDNLFDPNMACKACEAVAKVRVKEVV